MGIRQVRTTQVSVAQVYPHQVLPAQVLSTQVGILAVAVRLQIAGGDALELSLQLSDVSRVVCFEYLNSRGVLVEHLVDIRDRSFECRDSLTKSWELCLDCIQIGFEGCDSILYLH